MSIFFFKCVQASFPNVDFLYINFGESAARRSVLSQIFVKPHALCQIDRQQFKNVSNELCSQHRTDGTLVGYSMNEQFLRSLWRHRDFYVVLRMAFFFLSSSAWSNYRPGGDMLLKKEFLRPASFLSINLMLCGGLCCSM